MTDIAPQLPHFFDHFPDKTDVTQCFAVATDGPGETRGTREGWVVLAGDDGEITLGDGPVWTCKEQTPNGPAPLRIDGGSFQIVVQQEKGARLWLRALTPDGNRYDEWLGDGEGEVWERVRQSP